MKRRLKYRLFVYFMCLSFLMMMNGFPKMVAAAKEGSIPIGEMVSKGEVKFEARQNVWKGVESSHFPIFQGTRIKTEKGIAIVTVSDNSQIEVSPHSLFSMDQNGQFVLSKGGIQFHIPSASEINFKVGNLSISKARVLQAAKNSSATPSNSEETIGSLSIHENGALTVKSLKGKLTVVNQDRVVLAAVSSKDSVTIPSIRVGGKPPVMVAQVGEVATGAGGGTFFGMSSTTLLVIAGGVAVLGGTLLAVGKSSGGDDNPVCP